MNRDAEIAALEEEINAGFDTEFEFPDKPESESEPTGEPGSDDAEEDGEEYLFDNGTVVTFEDDGETFTGTITGLTENNGQQVYIVDDGSAEWEIPVDEVTEVRGAPNVEEPPPPPPPAQDPVEVEDPETDSEIEEPEEAEEPEQKPKKRGRPPKTGKKTSKKTGKKAPKKTGKKQTKSSPPAEDTPVVKGREVSPSGQHSVMIFSIEDITVPESQVRDFSPDDSWIDLRDDIKSRGLDYPIVVDSFESPTLVEGMRRLKAYEALGKDEIPAIRKFSVDSDDDRLWHGALSNYHRKQMHWIELGTLFTKLAVGQNYKQRKIAKAFGIREEKVSRLIAAVSSLPKRTLELAADDAAPESVFLDLVSCPAEVIEEITEMLSAGEPVTCLDVAEIKNRAKQTTTPKVRRNSKPDDEKDLVVVKPALKKKSTKKKPAAAPVAVDPVDEDSDSDEDAEFSVESEPQEKPRPAPKSKAKADPATRVRSVTYRDLKASELGDAIRVRVYGDRVAFKIVVPWDKKTYRGFDPTKLIPEVFDSAFCSEETTMDGLKDLRDALSTLRSQLTQ